MKLKVAVAGATGYTGAELLRILVHHPNVQVVSVTSEQSSGEPLVYRVPFLKSYYDLTLEPFDADTIGAKADLIFTCLAHTQAMAPIGRLLHQRKRVIDLSADYRLKSKALYPKWYHAEHPNPALLKEAVYGLTEVNRKAIAQSRLVANPGCYPTGALLLIYPFLTAGWVATDREIIIDSKSGISGAGRTPTPATHFTEIHEGMTAYQVGTHRHLPEIEQALSLWNKKRVKVVFTPYLLPVNRGILTTVYLPLNRSLSQSKMRALFECYKDKPFIRERDGAPNLSHVRGSNFCDISAFATQGGRTAILMSAIDNLVKGAAGQAVQNMNVMMGWDERLGLMASPLFP